MAVSTANSLLCSRSLVGLLKSWTCQSAALQCQASAAFGVPAAASAKARSAEPASTSGRDSGAGGSRASRVRGAGEQTDARSATAGATGAPASTPSPAATAAAASSHTAPCRLENYARTILHRELLLKLGPRRWADIPRLLSLEATIRASETKLERDVVEKSELLLHLLALETLTARPAQFLAPPNRHMTSRTAGVTVKFDALADADAAYSFLEKLVHVILPNQVGFEGVAPPTPVKPKHRSEKEAYLASRRAASDHRVAPLRPFATQLRVINLLPYPDFEQNFALFEPLSGMRVRFVVEGVASEDCSALLTGLSVPVLTGAAAEAALAAAEAEALAELRAKSKGG